MRASLRLWRLLKHYPVLLLGDIEVHCNHTDSAEQAISDWKRRREKVNYNNIIAAFINKSSEEEERFYKLTLPCRKICFTGFDSEKSYFCPGEKNSDFIDNVNHTDWLEQNPFDVRTLLLGSKSLISVV